MTGSPRPANIAAAPQRRDGIIFRRNRRPTLTALAGLTALLGCGEAQQTTAAAEAPAPEAVGELAIAATPSFHTRYGVPGPWSRQGGSREDFDADSRGCQDRSVEARTASDDPNDAAYRAFLECMDEREWTRGITPEPAAPAEQGG